MRIAIIQSCYVPWKGFFDLIGRCDEYVIFDSVQYVKRHWHNRNRIKTASGVEWMAIPVLSKARYDQPIQEVRIERSWAEKHWRALELSYRRAPYFAEWAPRVRHWYERADRMELPTDANSLFLCELASALQLKTKIVRDTCYPLKGTKTERLLGIARAAAADIYLSGPSAKEYLDEPIFAAANIEVEWMRYGGYPEYQQLYGEFEHAVSVLDLLFNTGSDAPRFLTPLASVGSATAAQGGAR